MSNKRLIKYQSVFIFVLFLACSLVFQFSFPNLLGVDGYYHITMAEIIREQGVVGADGHFPYLYFTTLRETYANQHFLYHILLIPFTYLDLILGAKLAAAFFSALSFFSCYVFLRVLKVRFAIPFSLLMPIASEGFLFRMTLPRAPAVALAATLFLLSAFFISTRTQNQRAHNEHALITRWRLLVFIGSFLIVWLYGGFVLYGVLITGVAAFALVYGLIFRQKKIALSFVISYLFATAGIFLGLVSHPYFPQILTYLRAQLFDTGVFAHVAVGGEWVPYSLEGLFANAYMPLLWFGAGFFIIILNGIALVDMYFRKRVITTRLVFLKRISHRARIRMFSTFYFAVCSFGLIISSRRYVEYFVPFAVIFFAVVFSYVFSEVRIGTIRRSVFLLKNLSTRGVISRIICVIGGVLVVVLGCANVYFVYRDASEHVNDRKISDILEVTTYTREHIPEGEVIFNVAWDDFPMLFFGDHEHYYAWGLDPTFLYLYSPDLYEKGKLIWGTDFRSDIHSLLSTDFGVKYVYVNFKDSKLRDYLKHSSEFDVLFENNAGTVFRVH